MGGGGCVVPLVGVGGGGCAGGSVRPTTPHHRERELAQVLHFPAHQRQLCTLLALVHLCRPTAGFHCEGALRDGPWRVAHGGRTRHCQVPALGRQLWVLRRSPVWHVGGGHDGSPQTAQACTGPGQHAPHGRRRGLDGQQRLAAACSRVEDLYGFLVGRRGGLHGSGQVKRRVVQHDARAAAGQLHRGTQRRRHSHGSVVVVAA